MSDKIFPNNKTKTKIIFKIIGVADATANLLCELRIAEKKDDKLTKNKKGKVILVNKIANSIFSEFSKNTKYEFGRYFCKRR